MRRAGAAAASARSAPGAASSSRAAASCDPAFATARGCGYGRGWGVPAAVGLGVLGAAAVGAAAYGYSDPCVRQQQVYDMYGNVVWQPVRVC